MGDIGSLIKGPEAEINFLKSLSNKTGTSYFINSGVIPEKYISDKSGLNLAIYSGFGEIVASNSDLFAASLIIPPNSHLTAPHVHPGGELAIITKGSYSDADLDDNLLATYNEGDSIFYNKFSIHRPVSESGASVVFIAFSGNKGADKQLSAESPKRLIEEMANLGAPTKTVAYALKILFPNTEKLNAAAAQLCGQNQNYILENLLRKMN